MITLTLRTNSNRLCGYSNGVLLLRTNSNRLCGYSNGVLLLRTNSNRLCGYSNGVLLLRTNSNRCHVLQERLQIVSEEVDHRVITCHPPDNDQSI